VRTMIRSLVCLAALVCAGSAAAQTYPVKPIRMIVTFAAGGPTDVIARIIAQRASETFGQQVVVENIAGAGGNIALAAALRAPADGYTVVAVSTGFIVNPSLYAKVPYAIKDFAPISLVAASPNVITVHPSFPAKTVQELIAQVKANPGKYSYAQPGIGSTPHLGAELFKMKFGLDLTMVPFGSAAPAITSTIGNHTPIAFTALPPAIANVKDSKLRGLAVLATKRNPELPDVPTMAEAGVPDQESDTVTGIVTLAGTPPDIVERWHREVVRIVALPEVNQRLRTLGFDPVGNSPAEYAERIRTEGAKWDKVAKDAKISIE
jgi:tripartite-type tricarboxylate transporter receptor subunit TctC